MKKIYIYQSELLKIAKIIKDYLPGVKTFIHFHQNKIVLTLPRGVERLKIEELKTLLKIRYPNYQIIFYSE
mgnify:CR=1 FL=1